MKTLVQAALLQVVLAVGLASFSSAQVRCLIGYAKNLQEKNKLSVDDPIYSRYLNFKLTGDPDKKYSVPTPPPSSQTECEECKNAVPTSSSSNIADRSFMMLKNIFNF